MSATKRHIFLRNQKPPVPVHNPMGLVYSIFGFIKFSPVVFNAITSDCFLRNCLRESFLLKLNSLRNFVYESSR